MPTVQVHGAEMYYEEAGSGPPLILSPGGLQGALASYQPVRAKLSQAHRVIAYDRRFGYECLGKSLTEVLAHRVIAYDRRFGGQSNSPLVVQTWDMVCQDVIGLMDVLSRACRINAC